MKFELNGILVKSFLFVMFVIVFTMAFWKNSFKSVDQRWFEQHQFDSEALVIGRLGETQLNGLGSYQGRLGTYKLDRQRRGLYTNEDYVYEHESESGVYRPYSSQIGFQGMLFSWIDQALRWIPGLGAMERKNVLHLFASFLSAVSVAALLYFILLELGFFVGIAVAIVTLYSQWLIVFGKNLYWVIFFMYLPMVITCFYYRVFPTNKKNLGVMLSIFALAIAVKCACGFEYLTTIVLASFFPIVYFAIKRGWPFLKLVAQIFWVGVASIVGFLLTFMAHVYQQAVGDDISFGDALIVRFVHAAQRLHKKIEDASNDVWVKAGDASIWEVVGKYWNGEIFDLGYLLGEPSMAPIHFSTFIIIFAILTPLVLTGREYLPSLASNRRILIAVLAASWLAFLGTLSWYVFAKVHSYFHGHMNHVLWHMPFTALASAYIFLVIKFTAQDYLLLVARRIGFKGGSAVLGVSFLLIVASKWMEASSFDAEIELFTQDGVGLVFSEGAPVRAYIYANRVAVIADACNEKTPSAVQLDVTLQRGEERAKHMKLVPVDAPLFSSFQNICMAEVSFSNTTPRKLALSFNREMVGSVEIDLHSQADLKSYPLTDGNWSKGIARNFSGFFVENSIINRLLLRQGGILEFAESGEREITRVSISKSYINVTVNGKKLVAKNDGYPAIIVVKNVLE